MYSQFMIMSLTPLYQGKVVEKSVYKKGNAICKVDRAKRLMNGMYSRMKTEAEELGLTVLSLREKSDLEEIDSPPNIFALIATGTTKSDILIAALKQYRKRWVGKQSWLCFGNLELPWQLTEDILNAKAQPLCLDLRDTKDQLISKVINTAELEANVSMMFQKSKLEKKNKYAWQIKESLSAHASRVFSDIKGHFIGDDFYRLSQVLCELEAAPENMVQIDAPQIKLKFFIARDNSHQLNVGSAFYGEATWPCWLMGVSEFDFIGQFDSKESAVIHWGGSDHQTSQLIFGNDVLEVRSVLKLSTRRGEFVYRVSDINEHY